MPKKEERSVSIGRLVPNMITIMGLCLGLSAIKFAMIGQWKYAAAFIIIASIFDGLDGRVARMLNATSKFGAQLDSLADFINFGVAPPFILYLWSTHQLKGFGWAMVLFFVVCCAIRLARFNSDLDGEEKPAWAARFFTGIPAPAGAMLTLAPMGVDFAFREEYTDIYSALIFTSHPVFVVLYSSFIAVLMASRLPTFSFKKITIMKKYSSLVLVLVSLLAVFAFTEPWLTMIGLGIWYISTIPMSLIYYYRLKD